MSGQSLCGVLAINKPQGMISKDVSRWLTKRLGRSVKLGHVGTLDPAADGVLPILFGKATRLQDYMLELPKSYICKVRLGSETDSMDLDGAIINEKDWKHVTLESLKTAAAEQMGKIVQIPPLYSAVKFRGTPLYTYARSGREKEIDFSALSRTVEIYECEILAFEENVFTLKVRCSKGTYIRVIAQQIAQQAKTCATVIELKRTEAAGINIEQSVTLDEIEQAHMSGDLHRFSSLLIPLNKININLSRFIASDPDEVRSLFAGQTVDFSSTRLKYGQNFEALNFSPGSQSQALFLDSSERVLGLASVNWLNDGNVRVGMKRSLV